MSSRIVSIVLAFVACAAAFPSPSTGKRQNLATVIDRCTVPNTVALTFDDGPWQYGTVVSDTLVAHNATGTFFYNSNNWDCIYNSDEIDRVKYVYDHGHQIASHTGHHWDLTKLSWDEIHNEMWLSEQAIFRITGAYPAFTRPPFGAYNDLVLQAAYKRGQKVVMWDFDSGDSVGASVAQQKQNYDDIIQQRPSTILTLNHETYETTVYDTLPYAIQQLQAAGYRLVSLAECLGEKPYSYVGTPAVRDSSWVC